MDGLDKALEDYRADYTRYYEACRHDNSPKMRDPNPVIFLVPGVGMFSFAKDKATARIAGEFYVNAINVMRGASTVSQYQGLPEQRSEEHTSELQSLMRISYAVFCLKKK